MMIELGASPEKLVSVLNYDGTPITADKIFQQIKSILPDTELTKSQFPVWQNVLPEAESV
jgi:hypothetical protein